MLGIFPHKKNTFYIHISNFRLNISYIKVKTMYYEISTCSKSEEQA